MSWQITSLFDFKSEIVSEFHAKIAGVSIYSQQNFYHLEWMLSNLCEVPYFLKLFQNTDFDLAEFVRDLRIAFENCIDGFESVSIDDVENELYFSVIDHSERDAEPPKFLVYNDEGAYRGVNEKIANGVYIKSKK